MHALSPGPSTEEALDEHHVDEHRVMTFFSLRLGVKDVLEGGLLEGQLGSLGQWPQAVGSEDVQDVATCCKKQRDEGPRQSRAEQKGKLIGCLRGLPGGVRASSHRAELAGNGRQDDGLEGLGLHEAWQRETSSAGPMAPSGFTKPANQ
uniref:Uncharacterized protein n=1 Tax=Rangifer tarandus platyrhynchus TaxID=3082113 RepID=A0ACB0E6M9_RANTA|nr:unnamed protein product [Rangifer tarandus platyrhynchus]